MARKRTNPTEQMHTITSLTEIPADGLTREQREMIFAIAAEPADEELMLRAAVLLSKLYPALAPQDPDFAHRTHVILLRDLRDKRKTLAHPSCSWLVMTHLREENLAHIPWQSTEEVASAAECFYGFCDDCTLSSEDCHRRVRDLVKFAGLHFVRQGRYEEAFQLLTRVPVPASVMDADLFRLRNTLILFEQRRVQRTRRSLGFVLLGVLLFITILSPALFLLLENPYRVKHDMGALSFFDALYWSFVTATTVGYGDVVPQTAGGRVLAVFDSVLGMTVMGLIAGFLLATVTPRQLP
jgi:hypothetical protein